MSSRSPTEIGDLMAPVCKALIAISRRASAIGLIDPIISEASISFYPSNRQPWIAYMWIRGARNLKGCGQTPMEAVLALAAQVDAHDPALNWKTLGVEVAA